MECWIVFLCLQGVPNTLAASDALLKGATTLKDNLKGMKDQALETIGKLTAENIDADQQNERAKEVCAVRLFQCSHWDNQSVPEAIHHVNKFRVYPLGH